MRIVIIDKSGQILYEGIPHLHGNGIKIGSGNHCDIIVNKIGIAREQIQLRFNADGYLTLQDLQSPFGTVVNGQRLQPGFITTIQAGNYIELTDEVFMHLQPAPEDKPVFPVDEEKIFPFFLNSNEQFVKKCFSQIRQKLPGQHYAALTSAEGEITTKIRELSAILEVTYALNSITSFHRLLEFSLEMALAVTGAERGFIMLFNEELNRLETVTTLNIEPREMQEDLLATAGLINHVFESGESKVGPAHNFQDIQGRKGKDILQAGILSIAAVPLIELSSVIGVLYVDTKHTNNILSSRTEQLMQVFAAQAAVAINRARMFYAATSDPQTGIGNQKLFMQRLTEEFCRAQRHQKPISMILMDIDHFSKVNESYGKNIGDKVLKEAGKLFKKTTRVHDLVARLGADSFAMLLPETDFPGTKIVAEKLRAALSRTAIRAQRESVIVAGSFGLASSSSSMSKPADLLRAAEKALKQAQRKGGNQIG